MIDIANKVVDTIYNAVKAQNAFPNADVTTGFDETQAIFPCIVVEETDNVPVRSTNTDSCAENYTRITFEISVYTNNRDSAKTTGVQILDLVDTAMQGLKFRRIRKNQPLNTARTLFRQYARYEVIVTKPVTVGNNTVYRLYRR